MMIFSLEVASRVSIMDDPMVFWGLLMRYLDFSSKCLVFIGMFNNY
jgi:hypothetical protein